MLVKPTTSLPLLTLPPPQEKFAKYIGRSTTTPLQLISLGSTLIIAEFVSEEPPAMNPLRSLLANSVKRLACLTRRPDLVIGGLPLLRRYWILTTQSLTGSGFSTVSHSVNPPPTLPSAKYQFLLTGVPPGVGVDVGEGLGVAVGLGVTVGVGLTVAVGEGLGVMLVVGEGVGVGVATLAAILKLSVKVPDGEVGGVGTNFSLN